MSERQRSSWHSRRRGLCARGRRPPAPGSAPGTPNNDWPCPPGPAPPAASEACRAEGRAARHRLPGRTQPAPRLNTRRPPSMSRTPRGAPSHWRVGPRRVGWRDAGGWASWARRGTGHREGLCTPRGQIPSALSRFAHIGDSFRRLEKCHVKQAARERVDS